MACRKKKAKDPEYSDSASDDVVHTSTRFKKKKEFSSDEESYQSSDDEESYQSSDDEESEEIAQSEEETTDFMKKNFAKKNISKRPTPSKKYSRNSNKIFRELMSSQLPNVPKEWKLGVSDMKRICKYIDTSIFDPHRCCLWTGYITNINNSNKGTYVNFYFQSKKVALHRLLYSNFVAPLDSSEYLKFNCDNKGVCCNINHYEKYKYSKNNNHLPKKEIKVKEQKKDFKDIVIVGNKDPGQLTLDFD